jgi:hypothetical protein
MHTPATPVDEEERVRELDSSVIIQSPAGQRSVRITRLARGEFDVSCAQLPLAAGRNAVEQRTIRIIRTRSADSIFRRRHQTESVRFA